LKNKIEIQADLSIFFGFNTETNFVPLSNVGYFSSACFAISTDATITSGGLSLSREQTNRDRQNACLDCFCSSVEITFLAEGQ